MKWKLAAVIVAVFFSGAWSGYALRYAQVGMFGYDPCWLTLADVSREARYQNNLGAKGWNFDNPEIINNCVLVDPPYTFRGWREMTRSEIVEAGRAN